MRVQPLVNRDGIIKNKIYTVYSKFADGSVSIEKGKKFIVLKTGEFKVKT